MFQWLKQWWRRLWEAHIAMDYPDTMDAHCGVCNEGPEACNTCPYLQDM